MYIEKIKINKFRVLEDIEVRFQKPDLSAVEEGRGNGNVVNVIAGVNGTGKTSLLDALYEAISASHPFERIQKKGEIWLKNLGDEKGYNWAKAANYFNKLRIESEKNNDNVDLPSLIFIPSQLSFQYQAVQQLSRKYFPWQKVNEKAILGNAEFYVKNYVLSQERASQIADPKQRTTEAIRNFNELFVDARMLTKLVDLDSKQFNRPVFQNTAGGLVTIDQLSDGEKQLYGRVIALMILEPHNSVILIDEPEIALHPAWQQKIMQIYNHIGTNNQFIVATHSPQVIRSVPYKNRIILAKQEGKIQPVYFDQPPSGVDVNSILSEVMGADPIPTNVLTLYQEYRSFIEAGQEQSEDAKSVRQELLEYEGEHSAFMQEMNFLAELRDAA